MNYRQNSIDKIPLDLKTIRVSILKTEKATKH